MGSLIDRLGAGGKLVIVGASPDPFAVTSMQLILKHKAIVGWPSGNFDRLGGHAQVRGGKRRATDD
jgi:hypothetical protein